MSQGIPLSAAAALIGDPDSADPIEAMILITLMDGRALTAKELAVAAHVTEPIAGTLLARLTNAGVLVVVKQGRHRYFRLASALVDQRLESVRAVAATAPRASASSAPQANAATAPKSAFWPEFHTPITWHGSESLRTARTCYDHLAGRLGTALAASLTRAGHVVLTQDDNRVTDQGHSFLRAFGAEVPPGKRLFCRPCLDWSERRPHLAGRLGTALATRCLALGWVTSQSDSRAVTITAAGRAGFATTFGIHLT